MAPYKACRAKVCSGFASATGEKFKWRAARANRGHPQAGAGDDIFLNFFRDVVLTG